ncbi:MAG: TAXI family TRAP transporter solute-binding subunit [Pseudomonadota bacterium]
MNLLKALSTTGLALGLSIGLAAGTATAQDQRLAFGATNAQSSHYAYFAALAQIVNDNADGYQASVVETGATVDNLRRMARGQLDIGLVTTPALFHANEGIQTFDGDPIASQLLWAYSLAPQMIVTRADAGYESIRDLSGERFGPGQRGSSTEATSQMVFDLLGVTPEWVRGTNGELANLIKDERLPGFVKSAVGTDFDPLTTDIATLTPLQVLPVSDEDIALIQENLPELSIVDMPASDQQGRDAPYRTWGFMIAVSASPEMDDETAYAITKAVLENPEAQAAAFPAVDGIDIGDLTVNFATSAMHPGAIRAFEELGYTVPDRLR